MSLDQENDPYTASPTLFFLNPKEDGGCLTAASAWAQCLHCSQGAVGVWEGGGGRHGALFLLLVPRNHYL